MMIDGFMVGDRVRVQFRGERTGLPPAVLANGLRIEAKRGRIDELVTVEEAKARLGRGHTEPLAWVEFDCGGGAHWPLWLLEKLSPGHETRSPDGRLYTSCSHGRVWGLCGECRNEEREHNGK